MIALFSLPLYIAFWLLMLILLLMAAAIVVWIVVAVILAVVETSRTDRERPGGEPSAASDPLSVFRESAVSALRVIEHTPKGDTR
ncbi:hypothetical protein [Microbacterium sp. GCS4]|uniref:hypothetical protein n=1 Tax=Microbacterium sp. GCS4 TaxID=1692239 RepID=UPI000681555D|nr:hypothetical protein [Microbacterium sp. GCS4]KNY05982.1 hypothetical protein AKH00_09155 [Microbacterium sp. GCS4]